jgi:SulP family sulfate permease
MINQEPTFYPKIFSALKGYTLERFLKDALAGILVGIIAFPLSIAFGMSSGVNPEQGIVTAVVAGFLISLLGGTRVQIGGPSGAFVVIIFTLASQYGYPGVCAATFMAGLILIFMGIFKLGVWVKFVPLPVVAGFTSGIGVVLFSNILPDIFGLTVAHIPTGFIGQIKMVLSNTSDINFYAVVLSLTTTFLIAFLQKYYPKLPSSFIVLILGTAVVQHFELPILTISDHFSDLKFHFSFLEMKSFDFSLIPNLIAPAITIALLCSIESLLSAIVSDGMIGGKHRSNTELIAQGIANLASSICGGIPATGALARTAINIKGGARSPIAGMVHSLFILLVVLAFHKFVDLIPMATLSGLLTVVAYNMIDIRQFKSHLSTLNSDSYVLILTFLLTVLVDLIVAIQVGMILSAFLFMYRMSEVSNIRKLEATLGNDGANDTYYERKGALSTFTIPPSVEVFEIQGAFFFGAASKFDELLRLINKPTKTIILRMNGVYMIDATGLGILIKLAKDMKKQQIKILVCDVHQACKERLLQSEFMHLIGHHSFYKTLKAALDDLPENEKTPS